MLEFCGYFELYFRIFAGAKMLYSWGQNCFQSGQVKNLTCEKSIVRIMAEKVEVNCKLVCAKQLVEGVAMQRFQDLSHFRKRGCL